MHGNVREWCADWRAPDYYAQSPPSDPPGPVAGSSRVYRGGGWNSHPGHCRSAIRGSHVPGGRGDYLGFRLACEIPKESAELKESDNPTSKDSQ